tara:strand:- start:2501 stop:3118 length:618 start_codon:yes stop_codon:yes gene_type:complete
MKNIFWDFDGVIIDSMKVRDWGFRELFNRFNQDEVNQLIRYHNDNGGLSRYVKIEYFYNNILGKSISKDEIQKYALIFSKLMRNKLVDPNYLILDTISFLQKNYKKYNFHIVSGSDQEELRFLCDELNISKYFLTINGSPTSKNDLVFNLLDLFNINRSDTCLIGDSINDYEAAVINDISFFGFNNLKLKKLDSNYILKFEHFQF